ncbi:MAG: hypothetical protein ALMCE001_13750 [Methanocorpusculum sp. MCE]|nr:MAG: hypothetical protein ALMCE001_13750 [Methanocorpusculum sp. MCE]
MNLSDASTVCRWINAGYEDIWTRYKSRKTDESIMKKNDVLGQYVRTVLEPVPWGPVFWKAFLTVDWSAFCWLKRYLTFFSTV